jgi:hypothetical protein
LIFLLKVGSEQFLSAFSEEQLRQLYGAFIFATMRAKFEGPAVRVCMIAEGGKLYIGPSCDPEIAKRMGALH